MDSHSPFEAQLTDYFRQRLNRQAGRCTNAPQEETLWYLSDMLARFGNSRHLFDYEDQRLTLRPLALIYQDARHAGSEWERCMLLRKLGDTALFVGALFPQSYRRRGLKQDYFSGMGRSAYGYLGEHDKSNPGLFQRLADRFTELLSLVADACQKEQLFDMTDQLQAYIRWQTTGDPSLARQLAKEGWFDQRH